jgi:hypothetical protein
MEAIGRSVRVSVAAAGVVAPASSPRRARARRRLRLARRHQPPCISLMPHANEPRLAAVGGVPHV